MRAFLRRQYDLDLPNITIEQPPRVEFGEYALPLAFELAKKLRKPRYAGVNVYRHPVHA